jgi:phytoene synthase
MVGFLEVEATGDNFEACRLYTRTYARTFYFASHVLPKQKRNAAYALYAFCRYADNIIDESRAADGPARPLKRLHGLRDQLRYVYTHSELMNPKLLAFRETVMRYDIPEEYFRDLLRGVEMDLLKSRYRTFEELREYCYCVASVVGLMMTRILGASDERALRHAEELGIAMQLTNILRDVGEDYERGRIYLPLEEIHAAGYSEKDLAGGVIDGRFRALMEGQIARAREYYARAAEGVPLLTNDGSRFCVQLMSGAYGRILHAIERNGYDVFTRRAYVPLRRKLLVAAAALLPVRSAPADRGIAVEPSAGPSPARDRFAPVHAETEAA